MVNCSAASTTTTTIKLVRSRSIWVLVVMRKLRVVSLPLALPLVVAILLDVGAGWFVTITGCLSGAIILR